ncbi:MAG: hypothetical protein ACOCP8_00245 [archaeon]
MKSRLRKIASKKLFEDDYKILGKEMNELAQIQGSAGGYYSPPKMNGAINFNDPAYDPGEAYFEGDIKYTIKKENLEKELGHSIENWNEFCEFVKNNVEKFNDGDDFADWALVDLFDDMNELAKKTNEDVPIKDIYKDSQDYINSYSLGWEEDSQFFRISVDYNNNSIGIIIHNEYIIN